LVVFFLTTFLIFVVVCTAIFVVIIAEEDVTVDVEVSVKDDGSKAEAAAAEVWEDGREEAGTLLALDWNEATVFFVVTDATICAVVLADVFVVIVAVVLLVEVVMLLGKALF